MLKSRINIILFHLFVYVAHSINTQMKCIIVNIKRDKTVIFNKTLKLWLSLIFLVKEKVENFHLPYEINGSPKNLYFLKLQK